MSDSLTTLLADGAFQGYAYAYPHKTAYRPINPPLPLRDAWADEDKSGLFLYAHIPFCEMRCGFCNLFTMTHPGGNLVVAYLDAMARQSEAVATALGPSARVARLALGGGTPTFLSVPELERLFGILNENFLRSARNIPKAIEASPNASNCQIQPKFLLSDRITPREWRFGGQCSSGIPVTFFRQNKVEIQPGPEHILRLNHPEKINLYADIEKMRPRSIHRPRHRRCAGST